jgi:hypothetical protein
MPSDYTPETSFFHVAAGAVSERTGQLFHNYSSLSFSLFLLTRATRKQNLPKNKSLFVLLFQQKFYSQTSAFTFFSKLQLRKNWFLTTSMLIKALEMAGT